MHLTFRNTNDAFRGIVRLFNMKAGESYIDRSRELPIRKTSSRNGDVLVIDEPVTITYTHPRERVLFNQARDCNPFFHLYESLWMLAGRNDVAPLAYYNSQIANYSDDGKTFNGAYGYRWRNYRGPVVHELVETGIGTYEESSQTHVNQLKKLIAHLKADPNSRRAVLQMWNVEDDLLKIGSMVTRTSVAEDPSRVWEASKDVCCNLSVMFLLRQPYLDIDPECITSLDSYDKAIRVLDMTVINRSNDAIWGMLGANVVHMSFLQEWMAANLGVEVGNYHQVTNNLHVYVDKFEAEKWLADKYVDGENAYRCVNTGITPMPLIEDPAVFEKELPEFVERHSKDAFYGQYHEPFLKHVAQPMCIAYHHHKRRDYEAAVQSCRAIQADDWQIVSLNWIKKRQANYEKLLADKATSSEDA